MQGKLKLIYMLSFNSVSVAFKDANLFTYLITIHSHRFLRLINSEIAKERICNLFIIFFTNFLEKSNLNLNKLEFMNSKNL